MNKGSWELENMRNMQPMKMKQVYTGLLWRKRGASFFPSRCLQASAFWLNCPPIFHACRCLLNCSSVIRTHTELSVRHPTSWWAAWTSHDFWHQKQNITLRFPFSQSGGSYLQLWPQYPHDYYFLMASTSEGFELSCWKEMLETGMRYNLDALTWTSLVSQPALVPRHRLPQAPASVCSAARYLELPSEHIQVGISVLLVRSKSCTSQIPGTVYFEGLEFYFSNNDMFGKVKGLH